MSTAAAIIDLVIFALPAVVDLQFEHLT